MYSFYKVEIARPNSMVSFTFPPLLSPSPYFYRTDEPTLTGVRPHMELVDRPAPALFQTSTETNEDDPPAKRSRRPSTLHTPKYVAMDDGGDDTDPEFSPRTTPSSAPARRPRQGLGVRGGPSKYRGVVWHKSNSKWEARIYEGGKQKFLGYYTSEEAAAHAYDTYAVRLHGNLQKLNFPELYASGAEVYHDPGTPPVRHTAPGPRAASPLARPPPSPRKAGKSRVQPVKGTSRFRGVSWNSNCAKWRAQVWKGSEVHHLGYFEGEEDAARAYDEAVLRIRGPDAPTNFPRSQYGAFPVPGDHDFQGGAAIGASGFRGVSWSDAHQAWLAELWNGSRFQLLGSFRDEASAARRYDVACLELNGADALTNFPLQSYEAELAAVALRAMAAEPGPLCLTSGSGWTREELEGDEVGEESSSLPAAAAPRAAPVAPVAMPAAPQLDARAQQQPHGADAHARQAAWRRALPVAPAAAQSSALRALTGSRSSPLLSLAWDGRQQRWIPSGKQAEEVYARSPTCSDSSSASHAAREQVAPGPSPLAPEAPGLHGMLPAEALQRVLGLLAANGGSSAGWEAAVALARASQ
uniref:AP2/ERF domain-containing protein n=1 Tax=Auxenochlorella protothecoides TaxID=3075 RepID=A0A1D1ZRM4_AUXPR